ncbi:integrase [Vibrio parahaemolyticus]|nr:integrase [Vibrio parahaemolyticus]
MKKLPRGVSERKHATGNKTLQITFTYRGVRCRESLSNVGTKPADIRYAENLLGQIKLQISQGIFKYADYFPKSKKLELFGEGKTKRTVGDYLDEYIETCEKKDISFTTINTYKSSAKKLAGLHGIPVGELKQSHLKEHFKGEKAHLKTCKKRLGILKRALDEAIVDGVISSNPCTGFKLSNYVSSDQRLYNTSDEVDPFTPKECERLIGTAYSLSEPEGNLVKFWINTGLRTGELIALQWENVDLVERTIRVKEAMVEGVTKDTKTKSSVRTVPLNDAALEALLNQKAHTFLAFDYVFKRDGGHWKDARRIRDLLWNRVIKKSGVRHRRGYNCRHTFATMNISQNVNLWQLSQWLGHTSPEMLFKHYGSYIEEFAKDQGKQGLFNQVVNR